jgi:hypothetical protein
MWHETALQEQWFSWLVELDEKIAEAVRAQGCRHCGGRLHRGNYERKPRGGRIGMAGEAFRLRYSLCCGSEGCRKRSLPPSLRFLGRRVYLEAVVVLATLRAMVTAKLGQARSETGVPVRTLRRWRGWWTGIFPSSAAWAVMRAQFVPPPPDEDELPKSLLERLGASLATATTTDVLLAAARLLSPVTTESVPDGSRLVATAFAE